MGRLPHVCFDAHILANRLGDAPSSPDQDESSFPYLEVPERGGVGNAVGRASGMPQHVPRNAEPELPGLRGCD